MEKYKTFTSLNAWKESFQLVLLIYKITKKFPKEELFVLVSQMRRCAISVPSNISEGYGRKGNKERIQFLYTAQGSILELKTQILIAKELNYIDKREFQKVVEQTNLAHKLLQGYMTSLKSKKE